MTEYHGHNSCVACAMRSNSFAGTGCKIVASDCLGPWSEAGFAGFAVYSSRYLGA